MRALALGTALCAGLNALRFSAAPPRPAAVLPQLEPESAVATAGLLSLGMRRLAADAALIRLIVYYGTPESREDPEGGEKGSHAPGHAHGPREELFDPEHPEQSWGGGSYPEMGPRARRILALDPSFSYAALFAAGALAFNLNRPAEALSLLELGLQRDPRQPAYKAYIGAIGFHRRGDVRQVIALLEPTLADPDCPTMIKVMLAQMYRRTGQGRRAARLYLDVIETSRDEGYRANSLRALREMGALPR